MKIRPITAAFSALLLAHTGLFAQQVLIPTKPADVTAAAPGVIMQPEYPKAIGRTAYIWGWRCYGPSEQIINGTYKQPPYIPSH